MTTENSATQPKRPLARIDVPNLVMHLREYETDELQMYLAIFNQCVAQLDARRKDRRLKRDIRRKAWDKLKAARKTRNQIRNVLLSRGANLELEPEEWETNLQKEQADDSTEEQNL